MKLLVSLIAALVVEYLIDVVYFTIAILRAPKSSKDTLLEWAKSGLGDRFIEKYPELTFRVLAIAIACFWPRVVRW